MGGELLLADPSTGLNLISVNYLVEEKKFKGTVLIPVPDKLSQITAGERQEELIVKYFKRKCLLKTLIK